MARPKKLPSGMIKRGDVYHCAFRAGGRLIRKRLSSNLEAAKVLLNEMRSRADRGDFGLLDNDYLWVDLKAEFLRWARQSVRDHKQYASDLRRFEEYCAVNSVNQVDHAYVIGFREWRLAHRIRQKKKGQTKPVTPRTVNREIGTLKNMLNRAVEWGRIGSNVIAGVEPLAHDTPAKVRRSLSLREVQAIFDNSPAYLLPVWRLYLTTGIRRNELVNLKFSDVDLEHGAIVIQAASAKNRKRREIPLDDEMVATIAKLKQEAPKRLPVVRSNKSGSVRALTKPGKLSKEHVFVNGANTPLVNNLLREFYAVCRRAGIEDAGPNGSVDIHALRTSFITLAIQHGADPKSVQDIVGHSTLAMTMNIYARSTDRSKRKAIAALPFAKTSPPEHVVEFSR